MAILVINTIVHFYTVGHLTALTALRQMDPEFETVSASLKQPFYRTFWRVTVPVCLPSTLDIAIYMFVNAMTTVSGVVFIYGPKTELASISVLNMDDTGEIASAAAMAMMISTPTSRLACSICSSVGGSRGGRGVATALVLSTSAWRRGRRWTREGRRTTRPSCAAPRRLGSIRRATSDPRAGTGPVDPSHTHSPAAPRHPVSANVDVFHAENASPVWA
jgi:hypothetical protein